MKIFPFLFLICILSVFYDHLEAANSRDSGSAEIPFDGGEMQRFLQNMDSFHRVNQAAAQKNDPTSRDCPLEKMAVPGLSCFRKNSKNESAPSTTFVLKYPNFEAIPKVLKSLLPSWSYDPHAPMYLEVEMHNDSYRLLSLGLMKNGPKSAEKWGDDLGDTHGTGIALGKELSQGFYGEKADFRLSYNTRLYTVPVGNFYVDKEGSWRGKQKYKNEDILQAILDTAKAGKAYYWKAEVGLVSINQSEGVLQGISQQEGFHKLLNKIKPGTAQKYDLVKTEDQAQWGAFMGFYSGLQKTVNAGAHCLIRVFAEMGGRGSSVSRGSFFQGAVGAEAKYDIGNDLWVRVGARRTELYHSEGRESDTSLNIGAGGDTHSVSLVFTKPQGKLLNTTGYNINNLYTGQPDKTWELIYRYQF